MQEPQGQELRVDGFQCSIIHLNAKLQLCKARTVRFIDLWDCFAAKENNCMRTGLHLGNGLGFLNCNGQSEHPCI